MPSFAPGTTVGAVLGIDSLGALFTDGIQRNIVSEILTGIVLTIAIALVLDLVLVLVGRALMPWARIGSPASVRRDARRSAKALAA